MNPTITLFWFRRDLRLHDNAGLYHTLKSGGNVQPIFIFDRNILDKLEDKRDRRVTFIHTRIEQLKKELESYGSTLWICYGHPIDIFKDLLQKHKIDGLYTNRDYEPEAIARDKVICTLFKPYGLPFKTFKDQVIFEKDEVLKGNGTAYTVFTPYSLQWKKKVHDFYLRSYPTEKYFDRLNVCAPGNSISLEEMGFEPHAVDWPDAHLDMDIVRTYDQTRDYPGMEGTTRMSAHLRFGTVSIRDLCRIASVENDKWYNELIWREFYQSILAHFPDVVEQCFKPQYESIEWRNDEQEFAAWCEGRTGYPIIDAGMRELNETGYMHNRVRMIVASFLVKHLLIDWRWGERYFAKKLLDFDLASNNGGWQWAAGCGVDAAPYFRVFNPHLQTKKFDPDLVYIRKWIPELESDAYPEPIIDHKEARERALVVYKAGLAKE